MDNPSSDFHNLIKNDSVPQILLLVECDLTTSFTGNFYLSSDGDMSTDGASFVDDMTQGEEYALGCVACRTMNVELMNLDGDLNGHNFGWMQAYIGAEYFRTAVTLGSGVNTQWTWNGTTYYAKTDGFYADSTLVESGNCTGIYSWLDGYLYFFIEGTAYKYKISDGTYAETHIFTDAVLKKFANGRTVEINGNGALAITEDGYRITYLTTCLGYFQVNRPQKTVCDTIEITDAFDPIHLLDVPAMYSNYDISTGYKLLTACASLCGLSLRCANEVVENRLKGLAIDVDALLNNSYTFRRAASFACEAVGCNARLKPKTRQLYVFIPNQERDALAYPVTASMVKANGIEVQEYSTHPIECVAVRGLENTSTLYPVGGGDYTYEFNGNPFVNTASSRLLSYVRNMPVFTPMTVELLCADPSFQAGDLVTIALTYGEDEVLTTYDGDDITTYGGEDIIVTPSLGKWTIPLMSQTIRFNGRTSATYQARGTEDRSGTTYDNEYIDTNARTTKYISSDYIVWSSAYNPVTETLASDVSLSAQTTATTNVLSISLDPGMWVVVGQVEFSAVSSRKVVNISDTSAQYSTNIARNDSYTDSAQVTDVQAVALLKPTARTTYYLNCASSASCSAKASYTVLRAFRIL